MRPSTTGTTGFDLLGVRERVQLLHGAVEIESSPGNGTIVTATFPAQRRSA
jgi:signal transduction histidine kinase